VSLRRLTLESDFAASIGELPGVVGLETDPAGLSTLYSQDSDALVARLVTSGIPFRNLTVRGATLEEAFLTLTERETV
jgi:ABC-2 type transport system ATP-binding protein